MALGPTVVLLAAIVDPRIAALLDRVSEEARVFTDQSPRYVGVEKLTQRGRMAAPRFKLRQGGNPHDAPAISYRTTELISEYSFGSLKEAPGELREIRLVVAVNGRPIRNQMKARLELAEGMSGDRDRLNKQMLLDMEANGMVGAATDLGQMLMLFSRAKLEQLEFTMLPDGQLGEEAVAVLGYRQKGELAARVYHGNEAADMPLQGELWIRRSTGLPIRITAEGLLKEGKHMVRHSFAVDYGLSAQGVLLPVSCTYRRMQNALMTVETVATYTDFKMFSADAEIKFEVEGEPPQ